MKAWLYYRLSRDEDEEMNSLYNQRQILVDYAEQQGYEIVGESSDDNVSGMTFERKGLAELENAVDEDKSLDVRLEFNGDFEDSVAVYVEGESA